MTKQQTLDSIASITKSLYRYTEIDHEYGSVKYKSVTVYESGLKYEEYYHANQTLQCKGLSDLDGNSVGTWWYCDSTGIVYKEYDFTTQRNILYKGNTEPLGWMFDSIAQMSRSICDRRYGKNYSRKHLFIYPNIIWYGMYDHSGEYPLMPDERPREFRVTAEIRYDSNVVNFMYFYFDDSLRLHESENPYYDPKKWRPFAVGFYQAQLIARNHGYDDPTLFWDEHFHDFYWKSTKCDPKNDEDCDYEIYSATTGKPIPLYMVPSSTCGTRYYFTEICKDTVIPPPGSKEVSMEGARFIAPLNWLVYSFDSWNGSSYMTNGTDTIFGKSDCMRWGYAFAANSQFDTLTMNKFKAQHPQGVQGRSYSFDVMQTPDGLYNIRLTMLEPILTMSCSEYTYEFTANHVTAESRDAILRILTTVHFSMCLPAQ